MALTQQQIAGLDAASARKAAGTANQADLDNLAFAARQGYGATGVVGPNTGTADSTPIIRPGQYGMSDWKGYQAIKDATAEIIKIRQGANKDITDPTIYWKGQARNSAAVTDPRLNELSPGDQASIRMSKQATSSAALYGLDQERQYREKVAGDTMTNVRDIYDTQSRDKQNEIQNKLAQERLNLDKYNAGMGDGGTPTPTGKGVITDPTGNSYDISSYATDPTHETKIAGILNGMPQLKTIADIDNYLYSKAKTTPITGQMVADAAQKYGVSWEAMIAIMQQDSSLGTKGKGVRTNNPGNVGNTDSGSEQGFKTMQDGVDAVAAWLSRHKSTQNATQVAANTPTGQKNNNLSQDEMRSLAVETGIDLALIPQMTNQEVVNAKRKSGSNQTSDSELINSTAGYKIQSTYGLSESDISGILEEWRSGTLTVQEIKDYLKSIGKNPLAVDDIVKLVSPSTTGSATSVFGVNG